MFEAIKNNNIIWIILALCTIGSLAYAVFIRIKDKKRKQFTYAIKSNHIIHNSVAKIDKLDLRFDGKRIDDLSITRIVIWNSQNKEIRDNDMVSDYDLSVAIDDDFEILDAKILYENEPANKFTIKNLHSKKITLEFEYVDKKEGVVLQIIHTGKAQNLKVDCKIKGGDPIKEYVNLNYSYASKRRTVFGWVAAALSILCYLAIMFSIIHDFINGTNTNQYIKSDSPLWAKILMIVILVVGVSGLSFSSIYEIRKVKKTSVPNQFREYI